MRRIAKFEFLSLLCLRLALAASGQAPQARLQVHTATGASTFRMGERIPLQLDFTAPASAHLSLNMASYDRSGRMPYETFEVSPSSGATDPLASYFSRGSFMGGGLTGFTELSPETTTIPLDLNEWVRFDQPGDYILTMHSRRTLAPGQPFPGDDEAPLTAKPLRLHIIPASPEWQRARLTAALSSLISKPGSSAPLPPQTTAALADIRFLASPESIPVLVAGLGDAQTERNFPFGFGLIGLPPNLQDTAVRALRQSISDPNVSVSSWLLTAFSTLQSAASAGPDGAMGRRGAAAQAAVQEVLAALPRKSDKAKADTADLLLREYTGSLDASAKATIAMALSSTFPDLPEDKQADLLNGHWDLLRSALSADLLAHAATLPLVDPGDREMGSGNRLGLKAAALSRWYALDPTAATQAAYAQIGSASPSLTAGNLSFLPATPLPQFEALWAEALLAPDAEHRADPEVLAGLMTRFGTGAFSSQLAARTRRSLDAEACAPQAAMLAYVVKFDPDLARPLLHDALQAHVHTGCSHQIFEDIARYTTAPVLTDEAIETIPNPDPKTASGALRYLSNYGTERALQPMLERYRAWSAEWAGRAADLQSPTPFKPPANWPQRALGENLAMALLVNQGWLTDNTLRSEILNRCLGKDLCEQLGRVPALEGPPYPVDLSQSGGETYIQLGPYNIRSLDLLKAKLAQFPPGATFRLNPGDPANDDDRRLEEKVKNAFEEAGRKLSTADRRE